MPQSKFVLEQSVHEPDQESFVSDEELLQASGILRTDFANASGIWYKKTETLIPDQNSKFDLGTSAFRFRTLNVNSGVFSSGLRISDKLHFDNADVIPQDPSVYNLGRLTRPFGTLFAASGRITNGAQIDNIHILDQSIRPTNFNGNGIFFNKSGSTETIYFSDQTPTNPRAGFPWEFITPLNCALNIECNNVAQGRAPVLYFRKDSYSVGFISIETVPGGDVLVGAEPGGLIIQGPSGIYFGPKTTDSTSKVCILPNGNFGVVTNTPISEVQVDGEVYIGAETALDGDLTTLGLGKLTTVVGGASNHQLNVAIGNNALGANIALVKTRSTTPNANTVLLTGDVIGNIYAYGADGAAYQPAAAIRFEVDGGAGGGDMPGRIVFQTTPDGTNSLQDRVRITQAGRVGINTNLNTPIALLQLNGNQYIGDESTYDADITAFAGTAQLVIVGDNTTNHGMVIIGNGAHALATTLTLAKTRSATGADANTAVTVNDILGALLFRGADGAAYLPGASISASIDDTPGTNDMPTRLIFATTANGSAGTTERMVIRSDGGIQITNKGSSTLNPFKMGLGAAGNAFTYCYQFSMIDVTTTVNATPTNRDIYTMEKDTTVIIELYVTGIKTDGTLGCAFIKRATIRKDGLADAIIVGSVASEYAQTTELATSVVLTTSGDTIRVQITGVAATGIDWTTLGKLVVTR